MARAADAYSPHKIVRHLDVIHDIRAGAPARPVHVQIILSDLCNQACSFCAYRDPTYSSSQLFFEVRKGPGGLRRDDAHPEHDYNPRRMLEHGKVLEILDDCAVMGVSGIQFTGGGEPTVHPKFLDIVDETLIRGLAVSVVSNGVLIGKKLRHNPRFAHLFGQVSWSRISLDAGDPKTYAAVRHVGEDHFHAALEAVDALRRASDASSLPDKPVVGVGYVVTPDNWRGVPEGVRLAKAAGAHNIRLSAQFSAQDEHLFKGIHLPAAELCRAAEAESDGTFTVVNRFGEKLADLRQKRPDYDRCGYQMVTTYIGGDLNVYRCCVTSYNPVGLVGSLKNQRFRELWMSAARAEEMARFDARSCERCQFNGINRFLEYALADEEPQHSEFV